jgi:hypothetical protein
MPEPYIVGFKRTALVQLKRLNKVVVDRIVDKLLFIGAQHRTYSS